MRTRFAPSPTGPLHLGHAYSALVGSRMAQAAGGDFLLRIEDLDRSRARPEWEARIFDDLAWLGLDWERPVMRQSERLAAYASALKSLYDKGYLYPCTCSRADIREAAGAPQEGVPTHGPDGLIYPGTCRGTQAAFDPMGTWRLNLDALPDVDLSYRETGIAAPIRTSVAEMRETTGDPVVARAGMGAAYHLAVVVDDAAQGITHVVRGADIAEATPIHVLLQRLLGYPVPLYHHHALIRDAAGKRLAKRDDARALMTYRAEGLTPEDVISLLPPLPPA